MTTPFNYKERLEVLTQLRDRQKPESHEYAALCHAIVMLNNERETKGCTLARSITKTLNMNNEDVEVLWNKEKNCLIIDVAGVHAVLSLEEVKNKRMYLYETYRSIAD